MKPLSEMLQDDTLDSKPEFDASNVYAATQLTMKQQLMLQAFQVFITKILDNHGNVSIMARKQQLSQTEITNALLLTKMVGDSYDEMIHKPE